MFSLYILLDYWFLTINYSLVLSPILNLILKKLQEQTIIAPFIILHGPWVDAQWNAVRDRCQEATWFFSYHDVLEMRDYSELLGKHHTIKVEFKKNDDTDLLQKQESYEDKGAREINDWLSHSPAWDMKILLIEHIDRTTIWAANALLKSFEEPLPNRIIIASTTNKDTLLPTILSRALLIHCDAVYTPAVLNDDGQKLFTDMVNALDHKDIVVLSKWAAQISKWNYTQAFLDNLLSYYFHQAKYDMISDIIFALRMISSNVSAEHTIFQLFLKITQL